MYILCHVHVHIIYITSLPLWLGKESACNAGDNENTGSVPGSEDAPGGGKGNPLQYSCQGNPMDREALWATVMRVQRVGHDGATNTFSC